MRIPPRCRPGPPPSRTRTPSAASSVCGYADVRIRRSADVRGADVRGADVRGADVRGADVRGADVRGCRHPDVRVRRSADVPVSRPHGLPSPCAPCPMTCRPAAYACTPCSGTGVRLSGRRAERLTPVFSKGCRNNRTMTVVSQVWRMGQGPELTTPQRALPAQFGNEDRQGPSRQRRHQP
ncbi:pentapeptide repeat-containing protein [Streptomyces sulfonofaciens]|uniref:pentapeptide repeat-containing protein n=1 Tax=Streptomyces sulfonofaciens TaxID=68272 RepID=UPI001674EB5E